MNIVIDMDELTAEEREGLIDFLQGSTIPFDKVLTENDPDGYDEFPGLIGRIMKTPG